MGRGCSRKEKRPDPLALIEALALHAAKRRGGDFGVHNVTQACADLPAIEQALDACADWLRDERGALRRGG